MINDNRITTKFAGASSVSVLNLLAFINCCGRLTLSSCPPSCSLTSPPQQNGGENRMENSWDEIKTGRSPTNRRCRQNKTWLGDNPLIANENTFGWREVKTTIKTTPSTSSWCPQLGQGAQPCPVVGPLELLELAVSSMGQTSWEQKAQVAHFLQSHQFTGAIPGCCVLYTIPWPYCCERNGALGHGDASWTDRGPQKNPKSVSFVSCEKGRDGQRVNQGICLRLHEN